MGCDGATSGMENPDQCACFMRGETTRFLLLDFMQYLKTQVKYNRYINKYEYSIRSSFQKCLNTKLSLEYSAQNPPLKQCFRGHFVRFQLLTYRAQLYHAFAATVFPRPWRVDNWVEFWLPLRFATQLRRQLRWCTGWNLPFWIAPLLLLYSAKRPSPFHITHICCVRQLRSIHLSKDCGNKQHCIGIVGLKMLQNRRNEEHR